MTTSRKKKEWVNQRPPAWSIAAGDTISNSSRPVMQGFEKNVALKSH
jgi:hypothetical protein